LYRKYLQGFFPEEKLNLLGIPAEPFYMPLRYNKLMFDYVESPNKISDNEFFERISTSEFSQSNSVVIKYNYYAFLINHETETDFANKVTTKDLEKFMPVLEKSGIDSSLVADFKLFYHFRFSQERLLVSDFNGAKNSLAIIRNYYSKKDYSSDNEKLEVAKYFLSFGQNDWAMELLQTLVKRQNPSHEALILVLKQQYAVVGEKRPSDYYQTLIDAHEILTQEEWCGLFAGTSKINFQVFDYEPLRNLYCTKCEVKP